MSKHLSFSHFPFTAFHYILKTICFSENKTNQQTKEAQAIIFTNTARGLMGDLGRKSVF